MCEPLKTYIIFYLRFRVMFRPIKLLLKSIFRPMLSEQELQVIKIIGLKKIIHYLLFQRILRINSHVPWPVHWSSIVSCPERIERKYWRPYPGYMPGQYIQANGIVSEKT
jgi:hypothetical protein